MDTLTLGGIVFQDYDYAPPDHMPFGGKQAMKVHKLPGGSRVIDTLGPDEADITFTGFILADNAISTARALDSLRASGQQVALTFAGMHRLVVVENFEATIRRYPQWVGYTVSCTVASNPGLGNLGAMLSTLDSLIAADLAAVAAAAVQ